MTHEALVMELRRLGVELAVQGDALRYRPRSVVTAALLAELHKHKAALVGSLRASMPEALTPRSREPDSPRRRPASLLGTLRELFGPMEVLSIRPDPTWHRNRAARLIREARRRQGRDRAVALRDAFAERVAICTIDGGQDQQAELIALEELRNLSLLLSK